MSHYEISPKEREDEDKRDERDFDADDYPEPDDRKDHEEPGR